MLCQCVGWSTQACKQAGKYATHAMDLSRGQPFVLTPLPEPVRQLLWLDMSFFSSPKSVRIANPRLACLHWLLLVLFLAGCVINLIFSRNQFIEEDIADSMFVESWIKRPDFASMRQSVADAMNSCDIDAALATCMHFSHTSQVRQRRLNLCRKPHQLTQTTNFR